MILARIRGGGVNFYISIPYIRWHFIYYYDFFHGFVYKLTFFLFAGYFEQKYACKRRFFCLLRSLFTGIISTDHICTLLTLPVCMLPSCCNQQIVFSNPSIYTRRLLPVGRQQCYSTSATTKSVTFWLYRHY